MKINNKNLKDSIIAIIFVAILITMLFIGYFLGSKDSFALSCINSGLRPVKINNYTTCISPLNECRKLRLEEMIKWELLKQ